jgi:hypothetical protein
MVLETIRLLSDFETPRAKLLQIILSGQPGLANKLARPSLAQLRQRISLIGRLNTLTPEETRNYLEHRLKVAGLSGQQVFTNDACELIAEISLGIPRNINNLCFNALSLGYAMRQKTIGADILREVAADFDLSKLVSPVAAGDPATDFLVEEVSRRTTSDWPEPPMHENRVKSKPSPSFVANATRDNDPLTPLEAKAYMQRIIQLLRDSSRVPN